MDESANFHEWELLLVTMFAVVTDIQWKAHRQLENKYSGNNGKRIGRCYLPHSKGDTSLLSDSYSIKED